jgi:hypothetical protein
MQKERGQCNRYASIWVVFIVCHHHCYSSLFVILIGCLSHHCGVWALAFLS